MINSFGTLIQFLSAIYVTLSFDNLLFKSLWSMQYVPLILNKIKYNYNTNVNSLEEEIKDKITQTANGIETSSRMRGIFILIYCIILMWSIGVENNVSPEERLLLSSVIFITGCLVFIGLLFSKIILRRVIHVVITWLVIITFSILYYEFFSKDSCIANLLSTINSINIAHFIIIIILSPLLLQIYINWLYSKKYYNFLIIRLNKEYDLYKKALDSASCNEVPDEYKNAFTQSYFDSKNRTNDSSDTKISNIQETYRKRLLDSIVPPGIRSLSLYAFKSLFKKESYNEKEEKYSIMKGETIPNISSIEEKVYEYIVLKSPKPSIQTFCFNNRIDESEFRKIFKEKRDKK